MPNWDKVTEQVTGVKSNSSVSSTSANSGNTTSAQKTQSGSPDWNSVTQQVTNNNKTAINNYVNLINQDKQTNTQKQASGWSNMKLDSGYTYDEYVANSKTEYDEMGLPVSYKNTDRTDGSKSRVGNILSSASKGFASGFVDAASTTTAWSDEKYAQAKERGENVNYDDVEAGDFVSAADIGAYNGIDEAYHKFTNAQQPKMQEVASNLDKSSQIDLQNAKNGLGTLGQIGVDISTNMVQIGMDAAVSMLTMGTVSPLVSMFIRSAGSASKEARESGASLNQQMAYGITRGTIEVATEKMFDGLSGLYGKGIGDDLTEKIVQKLTKNDTGRSILRFIGKSAEEGFEEAVSDILEPFAKVMYDGGLQLSTNYGSTEGFTDYVAEIGYDFLIGAACGLLGGTGAFMKTNGVSQNDVANAKLRELEDARADKTMDKSDKNKIKEATRTRLKELGETGDTYYLENAITDILNGKNTKSNRSVVDSSTYGQQVLNELSMEEGSDSGWVKNIGTYKFGGENYGATYRAEQNAKKAEAETKRQQEFEKSFKQVNTEDGKSLDISSQTYNPDTGKIEFTVKNADGSTETVSQDKVSLSSNQKRAVRALETVLGEDSAKAYSVMESNQSVDPVIYATQFAVIRDEFGRNGATIESALGSKLRENMTDSQVTLAYEIGKQLGHKKVTEGTKSKKGKGRVFWGGGKLNDGTVLRPVSSKGKLSKDVQNAIRAYAEALEIDVVLFESPKNAKGNYVGANGVYHDGVIYLDVNAGMTSESVGKQMLFTTMSHELTHFIQQNSPKQYEELKNFIVDYLKESQNIDFDEVVRSKINRSKGGLSYEAAVDEVIADSCETMLGNSEAIKKLAIEHTSLAKSMLKALKKFFAKLTGMVNTNDNLSVEAREIMKIADQVQKMWDSALLDAVGSREGYIEHTNANGETVAVQDDNGHMQLSLSTYRDGGEESGRAVLQSYVNTQVDLYKKTKGKEGLSPADASDMMDQMDTMYNICTNMADTYTLFGEWSEAKVEVDPDTGNPIFSVVKANGDYAMNLDFSLVCKKRRTLDAVFNQMISDGIINDFKMVEGSIAAINAIIREHGFETACSLCFVDSKRYRQGIVADSFVRMWNPLVRSMVKKDSGKKVSYFNFGEDSVCETINKGVNGNTIDMLSDEDLDWTKVNETLKTAKPGSVQYAIAEHLKNTPSDRRLLNRGDFMSTVGFGNLNKNGKDVLKLYNRKKGAGGPKAAQSDVQYLNEVLSKKFDVLKAYAVGGVRIQSFSDYVPRLCFDYLQMIADLSAKKLPSHAYTKEPLFALQFGKTGIKTNMSLVPDIVEGGVAPGLDKDGNYAWKDGQSFGSTVYNGSPRFIEECYKLIGKEYKGQKRLTAEEGFELAKVIQSQPGYGANCGTIAVGVSQKHILKMLDDPNIRMIIPYHKSSLNHLVAAMERIGLYKDYTSDQNTRKYVNGKWSKITASEDTFNFNETLQELGGDPKAAADAYLQWCKENNYKPKFDEFADHENYYKLLEDFSCYDETGAIARQEGVRFNLPTADDFFGGMEHLIDIGLEEDAILQGKQDDAVPEIIKDIQSVLPGLEEKLKGKVTKKVTDEVLGYVDQSMQELRERKANGPQFQARDARGNVVFDDEVSDEELHKTLQDVYDGNYDKTKSIKIMQHTPLVYLDYCFDDDRSFVMSYKKAYNAMHGDNDHQHGLGVDGLLEVIRGLHTPEYIVYQGSGENEGHYLAVIYTNNGENATFVDLCGYRNDSPTGENGYYNAIVTSFYPGDPNYIDNIIGHKDNEVVYDKSTDKQYEAPLHVALSESQSGLANETSEDIVTSTDAESKPNFQMRNTDAEIAPEVVKELNQREKQIDTLQKQIKNLQKDINTLKKGNLPEIKKAWDRGKMTGIIEQGIIDAKAMDKAIAKAEKKATVEGYNRGKITGVIQQGIMDAKQLERVEKSYQKRIAAKEKELQTVRNKRDAKMRELTEARKAERRRYAENRVKREYKEKIGKLLKETQSMINHPTENKHIPMELTKQVVDVLNAINLDTGRRNPDGSDTKARTKLLEIQKKYNDTAKSENYEQRAVYNEVIASLLDNMIDKVGDTSISNMSPEQLDVVYKTLRAMLKVCRDANKIKIAGEERKAYDVAMNLVKEVRSANRTRDKWFDKYLQTQLTPERMFERLGNFTKGGSFEQMYRVLNDGQLKQTQLQMEGSEIFYDLMDKKHDKQYKEFINPKNLVETSLEDENGNKISLTHGMLVSLYMNLLNEQNARHITRGGITLPNIADYYKNGPDKGQGTKEVRVRGFSKDLAELLQEMQERVQNGEDALAIQEEYKERRNELYDEENAFLHSLVSEIYSKMTDYDKQWVKATQKLMDNWSKDNLNKTTIDVYGIEKASVPNYFPIFTDKDFVAQPFESVSKDMSLENVGFMKERVMGANPVMLFDVSDVCNKQIERTAKYCGLMPAIRTFEKVFNKTESGYNDSVRKAINSVYGKGGLDYIDNLMADLVGSRGGNEGALGQLLNAVRGNMARASLTLSLRTALGQTASYPTAAPIVGAKNLTKAFFNGGKNSRMISRADQELIKKYSPLLYHRMKGATTVEMGDLASSNSKIDKLWMKASWATGWINAMDGATVGRLWYAAEYKVQDDHPNLKKGTDEYYQEVAKIFNDVVEKTQPNYTTMQRPDILRNPNALVKNLTMFMTQRLQNFNILYENCARYTQYKADYKAGKNGVTAEDVRQAGRDSRTAVLSQIAAAATITGFKFLADAILHSMKAYRDDDEELTKESVSMELLDMFVDSITGNFIGGAEVYDLVESQVFGKTYYGIEVSSVSTVTDMIKSFTSLTQSVFREDRDLAKIKKNGVSFAKKMSSVLGLPLSNAQKIVDGIINHSIDIANGQFGSFEAGVERTDKQETHRLYNAYVNGKPTKELIETLGGKESAGKLMKSYIGELYLDGKLTDADVRKQLFKYAGLSVDEANNRSKELQCKKEYGVYPDQLKTALEEGKITDKDAVTAMRKYKSMTQTEAEAKVTYWEYDGELNADQYTKWYTDIKPTGVSVSTYESIRLNADENENGAIAQYEAASALLDAYRAGRITLEQAEVIWKTFNKSWKKTFAQYAKIK